MLSRSFFPNFGQRPFPKIAGKSPALLSMLIDSIVFDFYYMTLVTENGYQNFIHCLVLVQPRKIYPDITEKLLTVT